MSAFAAVSGLYENCRWSSVYLVNVEPGPFSKVASAHSVLRKLTAEGDDDLAGLVELLRRARYRLLVNILPAGHPALELVPLLEEMTKRCDELDPGTRVHASITAGMSGLRELLASEVSLLGSAAIEILETEAERSRALALSQRRYVVPTHEYLLSLGVPAQVTSDVQIGGLKPLGSLVCVGPHQLFPQATWNAARSETVCFVTFPSKDTTTPIGGLFGEAGGLRTPRFIVSGATESGFEADIEFVRVNEQFLSSGLSEASRFASSGDDAVEASLMLLEGGFAVWASTGDGSWMWTADFSESGGLEIVAAKATQVDADSFVIFRDAGAASELVRAYADAHFGTGKYRQSQENWKSALSSATERIGGFNRANDAMRSLGAISANARGWTRDFAIRPNRRQDFDAACRFAGTESESAETWTALSRIRSDHQRAGQRIRKQLEEALVGGGGQELESNGYQKIEVEGLGSLSVYRVLHRYPETKMIDHRQIDMPFTLTEP